MKRIVGIDFDNTIVSYDRAFARAAVEIGLLEHGGGSKKAIRDAIRSKPDGETLWMKLQSVVYAYRMDEAELIPGVKEFLSHCAERGIATCIVSHKTVHAHFDEERRDLRQIALHWMVNNGLLDDSGAALTRKDVYFEPTRREKIERIVSLGCTDFIDDLEEVFSDSSFPDTVKKILFDGSGDASHVPNVFVCNDWNCIHKHVFNA